MKSRTAKVCKPYLLCKFNLEALFTLNYRSQNYVKNCRIGTPVRLPLVIAMHWSLHQLWMAAAPSSTNWRTFILGPSSLSLEGGDINTITIPTKINAAIIKTIIKEGFPHQGFPSNWSRPGGAEVTEMISSQHSFYFDCIPNQTGQGSKAEENLSNNGMNPMSNYCIFTEVSKFSFHSTDVQIHGRNRHPPAHSLQRVPSSGKSFFFRIDLFSTRLPRLWKVDLPKSTNT